MLAISSGQPIRPIGRIPVPSIGVDDEVPQRYQDIQTMAFPCWTIDDHETR